MPLPGSKGKEKAASDISDIVATGKRRRDEDAKLCAYNASSLSVNTLLHPGGIPVPFRPINRRRLDSFVPTNSSSHVSGTPPIPGKTSEILPVWSASEQPATPSRNISPTLPPPPLSQVTPVSPLATADPFGYLDDGPGLDCLPTPSSSHFTRQSPNSLFASPAFLASTQNMLAYATPIHSHAYVTFGAGMRQKEVDQFCATNPLEAQSLAGGQSAVPYYIPLWVPFSSEMTDNNRFLLVRHIRLALLSCFWEVLASSVVFTG